MTVVFEIEGAVATVTIDRPEVRNAVDPATARALAAAFRRFDADEALAVAVLTGAGGTFCAGYDLRAIAAPSSTPELDESGDGPMGPTRMSLGKPVIAAVEGHAVAGGLELALWCDLRVAGAGAVFGVFNRRWGVPLIDMGTIRLPRMIGQGRALDMVLTGRPVDAGEALRIGLVERVVDAGKALAEAQRIASDIASFPQAALRGDRRSLLSQWSLSVEEASRAEFRAGLGALASGEAQRGAQRFAEGEGRHGAPPDRPG